MNVRRPVMNIRNYTQQDRICADSRRSLPYKVNSSMDVWNQLANNCNAKVTFIPGVESPIGPFGNWMQTITITLEGDYDNPKYKELIDSLQSNSTDRLEKLYAGDFSNISVSSNNEIEDSISDVKTKNHNVAQRRSIAVTNSNTNALLKRAFLFLEDGDWDAADEYCETVLDMDPECAEAYLGKLMAEYHAFKPVDLQDCEQPFDNQNNYQKAIRFGDETLRNALTGYIAYINERNENKRIEGIYQEASRKLHKSSTEEEYRAVAKLFHSIGEYKDASDYAKQCIVQAKKARNDRIYKEASEYMTGTQIESYQCAIDKFKSISNWRDSHEKIVFCQEKIQELEAKRKHEQNTAKLRAKQYKKIAIVVCAMIILLSILSATIFIPAARYFMAINALKECNYSEAIELFEKSRNFKKCQTSEEYFSAVYNYAIELEGKSILMAYKYYGMLPNGFRDAAERANVIQPYLKWCHVYGNGEKASFANGWGSSLTDLVEIRVFKVGDVYKWGVFCASDRYDSIENGEVIVDKYGCATESNLEAITYRDKDTETTKDSNGMIYIEDNGKKLISTEQWSGKGGKFIDHYTYYRLD